MPVLEANLVLAISLGGQPGHPTSSSGIETSATRTLFPLRALNIGLGIDVELTGPTDMCHLSVTISQGNYRSHPFSSVM